MKELYCDIWVVHKSYGICCVTTNGFVRHDGKAVMGRGVALQARERFPGIDARLGAQLSDPTLGNHVQYIGERLLAFPVKGTWGTSTIDNVVPHQRRNYPPGKVVPGWALMASIDIIQRSLVELGILTLMYKWDAVYLPRPGCGAGGLDWETQVRPICEARGNWLVVVDR